MEVTEPILPGYQGTAESFPEKQKELVTSN